MSEPSIIASDPAVSAWVAANAGAGKTYTLANRVTRLLLAGARPERILCLTFTKAAAAEMQGRLFAQLGAWAMLDDARLAAHIAKIGGDAHAPLRKARRLFAAALETPGGLKILTIHAFCQTVLSRFPIEAGVPPGFDVLDEASARALIAQARRHVLEQAGSGAAPHLAAAIALIVRETGEARLTSLLDAALGCDRRKLEEFLLHNPEPETAARAAHGLAEGESIQSISDGFCAPFRENPRLLKDIHAWLASGSTRDVEGAARLADAMARLAEGGGFAALGRFFLTGKGTPRATLATAALTRERPDLVAWLSAQQQRCADASARRRAARSAELTQAALTLTGAVYRHYRDAKRLRGVLDYDDLVSETRALLHEREAAAWVLYKLDNGIDHVLIDEAQDTSPEQWDIVRLLTAEFFSGQGARDGENPRTIFAVGDEKQSIFSFQGADPARFEINRAWFARAARDAGQTMVDQPLETSRRSAPDILTFVDQVFRDDAARLALTSTQSPIRHTAHRADAKGAITFWPPLAPGEREDADPWAPVDAVRPTGPVARLAAQVAGRIKAWLKNGTRLPGHDRPIRPGDIMILLPRRQPFGGEVIRQLKQRGVPVAGADRMLLGEQIAVMDLIALGRFVLQQEDDLTLAALLRSPLCGLDEDALFTLAHARKGSLWRACAAQSRSFPAAHGFLSAMLERAGFAPPFEFYAHCLFGLGGREKLLARLGPESADAVDTFLDMALAYERGHSPSLEGFLDWVEHSGTEIRRDMERGRDEVRVMTVHGAKGLEADIVILPDTAARPGGLGKHEGLLFGARGPVFPLPADDAPDAVQAAKAAADSAVLNEHRRLLYVALTRARDRLVICGFTGRKGAARECWYGWMRQAAEEMGRVETDADGSFHAIGTLEEDGAPTEDTEAPAAPPPKDALPDWATRPAPPEPAPAEPIRPSRVAPQSFTPVSSSAPRGAAGPARVLRGLLVHALLARLPDVPPEARARLALAFAAAKGFDGAEGQVLVDETLAVLNHPAFAPVFGPGSRAEATIHAARPDLGLAGPITGRIDRLAVTETDVLIVDFKTDRLVPPDADAVAPPWLDQMALYRAAAQRVFAGRRIACGLVFTAGPRLIALPDALLEARLAGLSARLGQPS